MQTELQVPSDLKFLPIVEAWLSESLKIALTDPVDQVQQSNRLRLVLVEAYTNVVRHAHQGQPNLPIVIRLELKNRELRLEIWDYGEGFDLSNYLPPVPQQQEEGGYGWLILHRLMDKVEYRLQINGRNCLLLGTTLPDPEGP